MNIQSSATLHPFNEFVNHIETDAQCRAILFDFKQTHAMNVNLLVFLLWLATEQYGRINKKELAVLLQVVGHWHERIVLPLRRVAAIAKQTEQFDAAVQQEVQLASQIEQQFLVGALNLRTRSRNGSQRLADACYNFALYCKQLKIHLDKPSKEHSLYLLQFIFNSMNYETIKKSCDNALQTWESDVELGAQLSLHDL